jgi:hypothetical protein
MIRFLIKRYFIAFSARRLWLIATFLPVLAYLVYTASRPDRFMVYQDITVSKDAPVALTGSPVGFTNINEFITRPDDFFLGRFALMELYMKLHAGKTIDQAKREYAPLMESIKREMSMTMLSQGQVRVAYYGGDQKAGEKIVSFFLTRLINKINDGINRSKLQSKPVSVSSLGSMQIQMYRALLRSDRALPAVSIFILFFLLMLVLIGVLEWADQSFISERQVGRYLGLPTLGALPDLNFICKSFGIEGSD